MVFSSYNLSVRIYSTWDGLWPLCVSTGIRFSLLIHYLGLAGDERAYIGYKKVSIFHRWWFLSFQLSFALLNIRRYYAFNLVVEKHSVTFPISLNTIISIAEYSPFRIGYIYIKFHYYDIIIELARSARGENLSYKLAVSVVALASYILHSNLYRNTNRPFTLFLGWI